MAKSDKILFVEELFLLKFDFYSFMIIYINSTMSTEPSLGTLILDIVPQKWGKKYNCKCVREINLKLYRVIL